jgi:tryptophan-rich sensory protein
MADNRTQDRQRRQWRALFGFLLLTLAVAASAALATEPDVTGWYTTLAKPAFNPPNWIFAPVWTALFVLMAIAGWRVWSATGLFALPMALFLIQLALNCAWSFIFFHFHAIAFALGDILLLWFAILLTTIVFWRIDRAAGILFTPYFAWVSFAMLLNAAVYKLN